MKHFSSLLNGLAKSLYGGKGRVASPEEGGREAGDAMVKEARRNGMILRSSGMLRASGSKSFVSMFSQRGEKGVNQDCFIVWEVVPLFLKQSFTDLLFWNGFHVYTFVFFFFLVLSISCLLDFK